jgi:LPXTG-site transpeptidase (sortase) family protein
MTNKHSSRDESVVVSSDDTSNNSAANLIRQKISQIYSKEPDIRDELKESITNNQRSKHQEFIINLKNSGKTIAEIQTEWHKYYLGLSDIDKNAVWQEFYDSRSMLNRDSQPSNDPVLLSEHKHEVIKNSRSKSAEKRSIKHSLKDKATANGQIKAKHNLQSLAFGLSVGAIFLLIFMFSFFNQVIITPFIEPSTLNANTPIILASGNNIAPSSTPEVIIPKIDVQIPVNYTVNTTNENVIENDLESGVVHFPTTVLPGQNGNAAFFGHSSNNIFNPGKYKFAFVLLHTLVKGDTFYLTYNDKVYIYKVISKSIVSPSDVSVLNSVPGQVATATLITCDPPGTSINRLVVVGQQISPSVSGNTTPTNIITASTTTNSLPSNGPSLWNRFISSLIGKLIAIMAVISGAYYLIKKLNKSFS